MLQTGANNLFIWMTEECYHGGPDGLKYVHCECGSLEGALCNKCGTFFHAPEEWWCIGWRVGRPCPAREGEL